MANTCKQQRFTANNAHYCTNWLRVISWQEQIDRLLVVIHLENILELASLRFLNLNLKWQNIKNGEKNMKIFFFHKTMF